MKIKTFQKIIQIKIVSMGTECSDRIAGYFDRDRFSWKSEVCSSYLNKEEDCICELDSEETQFLNESCEVEQESED